MSGSYLHQATLICIIHAVLLHQSSLTLPLMHAFLDAENSRKMDMEYGSGIFRISIPAMEWEA